MAFNKNINVCVMNIRAQTGLNYAKQRQIEDFVRSNRIDILHLQESHVEEDTFLDCNYISANYDIIANNSLNKFGTASLVKCDLEVKNVNMDQGGRVIIFDVGEHFTCGNFYLPCGSDRISRGKRENYCSEIIPNLLVNHKGIGICGGDFNCITSKSDATRNADAKMSPSLGSLISTFSWSDSFRHLHPSEKIFSRYYTMEKHGEGATRIDRLYHWGNISVQGASYHSLAFSDHMAHIVTYLLPSQMARILSPRSSPNFKVKPEVVMDSKFKSRLKTHMADWLEVRANGVEVTAWWEELVKPGIRRLGIERGKELKKQRRGELDLLLLRQSYLTKKIQKGLTENLTELKQVHLEIEKWYELEGNKIVLQSKIDDLEQSEKVRIYHHSLHQQLIKKSSILKLQTEQGLLQGHETCAKYLEDSVASLLLHPAELDPGSQEVLLDEVEEVFTEADNKMLNKLPEKGEVLQVLNSCSSNAAPGTDGLTALLYKHHWDILGEPLTAVVQAVFNGQQPTNSQRSSLMVFGSKPKKRGSLKPSDKRKISLLNVDFKLMSGIHAARLRRTMTRTVSPHQLVAGADRRIHHGIALARDAIEAASKSRSGCGILDTDLVAAFDFMVLTWAMKVLSRKGMNQEACSRLMNLYLDNFAIVVVNNVKGRQIENRRLSIKQGDKISMEIFTYGIDPVLTFLRRRLQGIPICTLPVQGPLPAPGLLPQAASRPPPHQVRRRKQQASLPPLELRYYVIGYCDDLKPAITTMAEFTLVDQAMLLFEKSSGCKMHRDPLSNKCKFLPLGRWRGSLTQEDIPCPFFLLSDHLDMLGATLKATYTATRKANGDALVEKIKKTVGPWRAGRHMDLTMRPHLINSTVFSKMYHRCTTGDLRIGDINAVTKQVKAWLYADLLEKPSKIALHRPVEQGGLGLLCVQRRALAFLISSFLETATNPRFTRNLFHEWLLRFYVFDEPLPKPVIPPYFRGDFFPTLRRLQAASVNLKLCNVKIVYNFLMDDLLRVDVAQGDVLRPLAPLRVEVGDPGVDWPRSWQLARLPALGPQLSSFLFKMLHQLLPTAERVTKILPASSPICTQCEDRVVETLHHALYDCSANLGLPQKLLLCLKEYDPALTPQNMLKLHLEVNIHLQFSIVWTIATFLLSLWSARADKRKVSLLSLRSEVQAAHRVLKKSKFFNAGNITDLMIHDIFD